MLAGTRLGAHRLGALRKKAPVKPESLIVRASREAGRVGVTKYAAIDKG
ncbi:hypothetical protein [Salinisphaera sp. LB1]|nr:hypothetical protein [Salinisphaera sp. LB1]AWN15130.1 hypothetical protein SALB1_0923 [Salinisphaera sp. LB1]